VWQAWRLRLRAEGRELSLWRAAASWEDWPRLQRSCFSWAWCLLPLPLRGKELLPVICCVDWGRLRGLA
jgi:hypothetical protein